MLCYLTKREKWRKEERKRGRERPYVYVAHFENAKLAKGFYSRNSMLKIVT